MINDKNTLVKLLVRDRSGGRGGWIGVHGSNGTLYSYRYAGGNQPSDDGKLVFTVGAGAASIRIRLGHPSRYTLHRIRYRDCGGQLRWRLETPTEALIANACTVPIQGYYSVVVRDGRDGATIPCDPMIINQPH